MIQIENRAEESDDGEDDDHAAYYLIDYDDAVGIKLVRYEERRDAVVHQGTLLVARLGHVLHRVAFEAVDSEHEEHQTAENLKIELVLGVAHKIHHKTHAQACKQSIYNVAACGTHTCYKPIPATLVECTLDAKDAYRPHRG